jgi:hypothetical protein
MPPGARDEIAGEPVAAVGALKDIADGRMSRRMEVQIARLPATRTGSIGQREPTAG